MQQEDVGESEKIGYLKMLWGGYQGGISHRESNLQHHGLTKRLLINIKNLKPDSLNTIPFIL